MMTSFRILFYGLLKGTKGPGPHLVEVGAQACDPFGIELIEAAGSFLDVSHEACILQHFEVLRNGWAGNGQRSGQLIYGDRTIRELLKDGHPGGVAESIESGL
jgi:hypothetical protein